jgi:hypothetical protein
MMSSSLQINDEMAAYDRKDRAYYDNFTEEDRKKFSTYLMLRYGASVTGSSDLQAYYLLAVNERVNKNFFDLNKHTKLQWLCCTTVSPGMGRQSHYWQGTKKKEGNSKASKFLAKLYPNLREDEIDVLVAINDTKSLKLLGQQLGMDDKTIKKELE